MFRPAIAVFLQKSWQGFSGLVTAVLVTYFLSPDEQGYYYAIGSLLSGYVLLDLGLSGLLVQVSARMAPAVAGGMSNTGKDRDDFLGMIAWSRRWYARASMISLLLLPVGFLYFSAAEIGPTTVRWQLPWVAVVLAVAFSLSAYPIQSIVEGLGRVSEVYGIRLLHYVVGALLAWVLLAIGSGLYAPAMAPLAVGLVSYAWWAARRDKLLGGARGNPDHFRWQEQLWPLQRKVALSWFSSYLFLNAPTLIVFYFSDKASAGQLGLSVVIANLLGSLCASWLIAKVPRITHLVAQDRHADSHQLFLKEFRKALLLMVGGYAVATLVVFYFGDTFMARRILAPSQLVLLFLVFVIFHSMGLLSVYFRARGRELLAVPAFIATVAGLVAAMVLIRTDGVTGVLLALLGAFALVALPGMYFAWIGSRDR